MGNTHGKGEKRLGRRRDIFQMDIAKNAEIQYHRRKLPGRRTWTMLKGGMTC